MTTLPPDIPPQTSPNSAAAPAPIILATWPAPPWATSRRITDDAIIHGFESVQAAALEPDLLGVPGVEIFVEICQADELGVAADGVMTVVRAAPAVFIDALVFSVADARRLQIALAEVLAVAVDL